MYAFCLSRNDCILSEYHPWITEGPAALELKYADGNPPVPVQWSVFVGDMNYGGYGSSDVIDFDQVTYFQGGEVGYGLRWIHSDSGLPVNVKIMRPGFAGMTHTQVWLNGETLYAGDPTKAKGERFPAT